MLLNTMSHQLDLTFRLEGSIMNEETFLMPQARQKFSLVKSNKSKNLKLCFSLVKSTNNDLLVEENDVLSQPLFEELYNEAERRHISPLTLLNHIVQKHIISTKQPQKNKAHG